MRNLVMSFHHEEIEFESNGNKLYGDLIYPTIKRFQPPYPGVVYFHGFPGNAEKLAGVGMSLVKKGFVYLGFDFQGIRQSDGEFSIQGEIQNGFDALDFLQHQEHCKVDENRIGIYGESLGGAIAICVASQRKEVKLTVVRAPVYDSHDFMNYPWIPETFQTMDLMMPGEVRGLNQPGKIDDLKQETLIEKNNPMAVVHTISPRKLFILASGQDELIPLNGVKKLFDKAKKPRILKIQPFADHNLTNAEFYYEVTQIISTWYKEHL